MDKYNSKAIFHLPGLFIHNPLYMFLLKELHDRPEVLKDNVQIGCVYGSPPVIWNGGRVVYPGDEPWTAAALINIRETFKDYNIPARFTFSNCLIEEKHLDDATCNSVLNIFNNGCNEIICNSPLLENYIREKCGDSYKYISSTTKRIKDIDLQKEEIEKDYYLTVIDYDFNKDLELLKSFPQKEKCEILCNPVCHSNCSRRAQHYEYISKCQLNIETPDFCHECFECDDMSKKFWQVKKSDNFISIEDINNIYLPMGFMNFKLEGRTHHPLDVIEILLYYLIKEEYKDELRGKLHSLLVW